MFSDHKNIQRLYVDIGCILKDPAGAMNKSESEREREREREKERKRVSGCQIFLI